MSAKALVMVKVEPAATRKVVEQLNKLSGAVVYEVLGPYDIVLDIEADTQRSYRSPAKQRAHPGRSYRYGNLHLILEHTSWNCPYQLRFYYSESCKEGYMAKGVAASRPASTGRVTPEIQRASSEARNRAAQATSQGVPSVPNGPALRRRSSISWVECRATMGLWMCPGAMQLTRTLFRP